MSRRISSIGAISVRLAEAMRDAGYQVDVKPGRAPVGERRMADLARATNIESSVISRYRSGSIDEGNSATSILHLAILAEELGVSFAWLATGVPPKRAGEADIPQRLQELERRFANMTAGRSDATAPEHDQEPVSKHAKSAVRTRGSFPSPEELDAMPPPSHLPLAAHPKRAKK